MRLFAAVLPPEDALDEVERLVAAHRTDRPEPRWTRRSSWHVTLAFYGEVSEATVDRLVPRLGRVAARHAGFELAFAGAGAFARPAAARTLWTGTTGDVEALDRLAASARAAGRRVGVPVEERRTYRPHLTLARCRAVTDLRPLVEAMSVFAGMAWTATDLCLVRSHPGARPHYETLRSWPLEDPGRLD